MKERLFGLFFLIVGTFSFFTNGYYIITGELEKYGRKQHRELPNNTSGREITFKVNAMFITGIFFLIAFLGYILRNSLRRELSLMVLIIFSVYASSEAMYYKHWKTNCFMILSFILLFSYIFI